MHFKQALQLAKARIDRNRRLRLAALSFVASTYLILIACLVALLAVWLGVGLFVVSFSALFVYLWRHGLFSQASDLEAAALIDRHCNTADRGVSFLSLVGDKIDATFSRGDSRAELIEQQLKDKVNNFDAEVALPLKLSTPLRRTLLGTPLCWAGILTLFFLGSSPPEPKTEQAKMISELLKNEELPPQLEQKLQELAQALDQEQPDQQQINSALQAAEQELEKSKQELAELAKQEQKIEQPPQITIPPQETKQAGANSSEGEKQEKQKSDTQKSQDQQSADSQSQEQKLSQDKQQQGQEEQQQGDQQGQKQGSKDQQSGAQQGAQDQQGGDKSKQEQQGQQQQQQGGEGQSPSEQQKEQGENSGKGSEKSDKEQGQQGKDGKSGEKQPSESGQDSEKSEQGKQGNEGQEGQQGQQSGLNKAEQALNQVKEKIEGQQQGGQGEQPGDKKADKAQEKKEGEQQQGQAGGQNSKSDQNSEKKQEGKDEQQKEPQGATKPTDPNEQNKQSGDNAAKDTEQKALNTKDKANKSSLPEADEKRSGEGQLGEQGPGLGENKGFSEKEIKPGDEKFDTRFTGQEANLAKNSQEAREKITIDDVKLAKPEAAQDRSTQPIPLEYEDLLR